MDPSRYDQQYDYYWYPSQSAAMYWDYPPRGPMYKDQPGRGSRSTSPGQGSSSREEAICVMDSPTSVANESESNDDDGRAQVPNQSSVCREKKKVGLKKMHVGGL